MRQLGELKKNMDAFAEQGVEVIAVFREERDGVEGLQKTKDKMEVDFTLALDQGAENTSRYSPGRMEFTSYVVDGTGVVRAIITGDLRNRAKSQQLLDAVAEFGD